MSGIIAKFRNIYTVENNIQYIQFYLVSIYPYKVSNCVLIYRSVDLKVEVLIEAVYVQDISEMVMQFKRSLFLEISGINIS